MGHPGNSNIGNPTPERELEAASENIDFIEFERRRQ